MLRAAGRVPRFAGGRAIVHVVVKEFLRERREVEALVATFVAEGRCCVEVAATEELAGRAVCHCATRVFCTRSSCSCVTMEAGTRQSLSWCLQAAPRHGVL